MFGGIQVPFLQNNTIIGFVYDQNAINKTPILLSHLTNMTDYKQPYEFVIEKFHKPVNHHGISTHTCILNSGQFKEIAKIAYSQEINPIVIKYFYDNVWINAKSQYSEKDKWKVFGYFMTNHIIKCIGAKLWNDNCLYYWSNVATTLKT